MISQIILNMLALAGALCWLLDGILDLVAVVDARAEGLSHSRRAWALALLNTILGLLVTWAALTTCARFAMAVPA